MISNIWESGGKEYKVEFITRNFDFSPQMNSWSDEVFMNSPKVVS